MRDSALAGYVARISRVFRLSSVRITRCFGAGISGHSLNCDVTSEQRDPEVMSMVLPTSQDQLPAKRMLDSYREAAIPLGSQPQYRTQFINQQKTVRIGKILESLDSMAGQAN